MKPEVDEGRHDPEQVGTVHASRSRRRESATTSASSDRLRYAVDISGPGWPCRPVAAALRCPLESREPARAAMTSDPRCPPSTPMGSRRANREIARRSEARNPDVTSVRGCPTIRLRERWPKRHRPLARTLRGILSPRAPDNHRRSPQAVQQSLDPGRVVLAVRIDLHDGVVVVALGVEKAVRIAAPTPTSNGSRTTVADSPAARTAVASVEPSSMTMTVSSGRVPSPLGPRRPPFGPRCRPVSRRAPARRRSRRPARPVRHARPGRRRYPPNPSWPGRRRRKHSLVVDPPLPPGHLPHAADLGPLPPLEDPDILGGLVQRVERAGVQPRSATRQHRHGQPALIQVGAIHIRDLRLAAGTRLQVRSQGHDGVVVEVQPGHGVGARRCGRPPRCRWHASGRRTTRHRRRWGPPRGRRRSAPVHWQAFAQRGPEAGAVKMLSPRMSATGSSAMNLAATRNASAIPRGASWVA